MSGLTVAVTGYFMAIFISFFVAGLIQLMGAILTRFSEKEPVGNKTTVTDVSSATPDDAEIAAVIVIARNAA